MRSIQCAVCSSIAATLLLLGACEEKLGQGSSSGDPTVVRVDSDDPRLLAAQAEARKAFPTFLAAFRSAKNKSSFAVKTALPVKGGGNEHMWIMVKSIDGNVISGTLDGEPVGDVGLKPGDPVNVTVDKLEDWMYMSNGQPQGGFTVAVLQKLTAEKSAK